MASFRIEKEADAEVNSKLTTEIYFCPLIRAACRQDCRCYNLPRTQKSILNDKTTIWYVYSSYCDSPMIATQ